MPEDEAKIIEEAPEVEATKYKEAPVLANLVAKGELPSVDRRLPKEPAVLAPLEAIGKYGGRLSGFALDNLMWGDLQEAPERAPALLRMNMDATIAPDIAKEVQFADDYKSVNVFLREGLKWSDGQPLTADDFLFMWEDMHWNDEIETWGAQDFVRRISKVDDYQVRFEFDEPHPDFLVTMTQWPATDLGMYHAKHYLSKWHIKYNPDAEKLAQEEGYKTWLDAFRSHYWYVPLNDINKPTTQPFKFKEFTSTLKVFERNPYYHMVDTAGNQLPYIDELVTEIVDAETYHLKVISGEADIAFVNTSVANFTLYKENESSGNYRVVLIPGVTGNHMAYSPNQNHPDPVLRKLYQDIRFRRALSLAIDREEINKTLYLGLAKPRAATILSNVSYYDPEWGEENPYIQYNPSEANRLLDEIGLTQRDRDGFRLRPDGATLTVTVEYSVAQDAPVEIHELVKEFWEDVGVKVNIRALERAFFNEITQTSEHGMIAAAVSNSTEVDSYTSAHWPYMIENWDNSYSRDWGYWLEADEQIRTGQAKLSDFTGGVLPGEEPPDRLKEYYQLGIRFGSTVYGSEEYRRLGRQIMQTASEELFMIGTIGEAPTILIAKDGLKNIPKQFPPHAEWAGNLNYFVNQWYWD